MAQINSTFGVSRLVMLGEAPHPVPEGVIEALIAVTVDGGIVDLAAKLQEGSPVRVMAGPFADQFAMLDSSTIPVAPAFCSKYWAARSGHTQRHNLMPLG